MAIGTDRQKHFTKGLVALFLFLSSTLFSLDYNYSLNKKQIVVRSMFYFECIIKNIDRSEIQIDENFINDSYEISGVPNFSYYPATQEGEKGIQKIVINFFSKKNGYHVFKGFKINVAGKIIQIEDINIEIGTFFKSNFVVIPEVEWVFPDKEKYFVGQNIPVHLVLKGVKRVIVPERVDFSILNHQFLEEIKNGLEPKKYRVGTVDLIDTSIISYYFSCDYAGATRLPNVKLYFSEIGEINVASKVIDILDVPDIVKKKSSAVGKFFINFKTDEKNKKINEQIEFMILLDGEGNFNNLKFPKVEVSNLVEIDSVQNNNFVKSKNGWVGQKSLSYIFIPEKAGYSTIAVDDFVYFSPQKNSVITILGKKISYKISSVSEDREKQIDDNYFLFKDSKAVSKSTNNLIKFNTKRLLLFIPSLIFILSMIVYLIVRGILDKRSLIILIFLPLFLFSFGSQEKYLIIDKAMEYYKKGEFSESLKTLKGAEVLFIYNPAFNYNLSLNYNRLGDSVNAIYYAKKSNLYDASKVEYAEYVNYLFHKYEIKNFVETKILKTQKLSFYILLISFTLLTIFSLILIVKNSGYATLLFSLSILGLVVSLSIFLYNANFSSKQYIIVKNSEVSLKKIPKDNSSKSFELQKGSFLYKRHYIDNYYLVENDLGLSGWISKDDVIIFP